MMYPLDVPFKGHQIRVMGKYQINYHVACQIQRKLLAKMDEGKTTATQLASLANSWNTIEERKRILRMKPKPRDVEVQPKGKAKLMHHAPRE